MKKSIVHDIRHSGYGKHHRNVYLLSPGLATDINIDSLAVCLSLDLDMFGISMADRSSVISEIIRALLAKIFCINLGKYLAGDRIQFFLIPFHQSSLLSFMQVQDG